MNDLSTEVKAKETHENAIFYHNRTEENLYRFVMEVKKIRDNRYYTELGFSNFDDYCMKAWNVDRKFMSERISIAEQFSEDDFVGYRRQFGHKKTLFLARMDEQQREQATEKGIPTDEGYKSIDEATQQEVAEYRRNAEEAERRAELAEQAKQQAEQEADRNYDWWQSALKDMDQARESEKIAIKKLEEEQNKEPKVIYKTDDSVVERLNDELDKVNKEKDRIEVIMNEEKRDAESYRVLQKELSELRSKKDNLDREIDNARSIAAFIVNIEKMLQEELAPLKYSRALTENRRDEVIIENVTETLEQVEKWCNEVRNLLPNSNYIDAEVIDNG